MFIENATTDAPIARMKCPLALMLSYLEDEVVASFPTEYRQKAKKAYTGLPDSDRDMEVMQLISLRDHLMGLIAQHGDVTGIKRVNRDLYWRTRIIALSDQARGVGA